MPRCATIAPSTGAVCGHRIGHKGVCAAGHVNASASTPAPVAHEGAAAVASEDPFATQTAPGERTPAFGERLSPRARRAKDPDGFWPHGIAFREPRRVEELFTCHPFPPPEGTVRYDAANDSDSTDDHLDGKQVFYHGTDADLSVGSHVRPRSKNVAHATPDERTARAFGQQVYEVEPLNRTTTFNRPMKYTQGERHTETLSEEGFRVRRKLT